MTARTDIHRPGSPDFDPQAYTILGVFDMQDHTSGGGFGNKSEQQLLSEALDTLKARGVTPGSHTWGCGHCGQTNLRYVALLVREDVQEWIFAGQDCLVGRFQSQTKESFAELRKAAELARKTQAVKAAWIAFCDANPAMAYATYAENVQIGLEREARARFGGKHGEDDVFAAGLGWGFSTLFDIARKSRHYGSATERQVALIERILGEQEAKWAAYVERELAKLAVQATIAPLSAGRQTVEGEVLTVKFVDNPYAYNSSTMKMLVKLDGGQRVWGTVPSTIADDVERGVRVRFVATVTPKDGETDFGFYSRPSKAEVVAATLVAA